MSGVNSLRQARNLERTVSVWHPVEVDPEGPRFQRLRNRSRVEATLVQHPNGEVGDAHAVTVALQVFGQCGKADWVQLEDGGGRHQIADRTVEDRFLPKIVHAGCVKQNKVRLRHEMGFPHRWVSKTRPVTSIWTKPTADILPYLSEKTKGHQDDCIKIVALVERTRAARPIARPPKICYTDRQHAATEIAPQSDRHGHRVGGIHGLR